MLPWEEYKQKQQNVNLVVALVVTLTYPNVCSLKGIAYEKVIVSNVVNYSIYRLIYTFRW